MRAIIALWIIGLALIFAAIHYDPDAGNRLLIDDVRGVKVAAAADRYSGVLDKDAPIASILPPSRYMGDTMTLTAFVGRDQMTALCESAEFDACVIPIKVGDEIVPLLVLPNTCPLEVSRTELFAGVTCHEIGHLNGWPGEHGP